MSEINIKEVVMKLVGPIEPYGDSAIDSKRLENLRNLIELTDKLLTEINDVYIYDKDSKFHSKKVMSDEAKKFLKNIEFEE